MSRDNKWRFLAVDDFGDESETERKKQQQKSLSSKCSNGDLVSVASRIILVFSLLLTDADTLLSCQHHTNCGTFFDPLKF